MYTQAFKVLEILEKSDKPVETSEIAEELSLSKSAVWKHINELRQDMISPHQVRRGMSFMIRTRTFGRTSSTST